MVDLSRRGLVQALTAAAGLLTTPGAAAAKAAMSIAEAPGFGAVAALTGVVGSAAGAEPKTGGSKHSLATQAAIRILDRRTYDARRPETVRASISCFRSASPVNKARWEEIARDADVDMQLKYEKVLEWLHDGTIKL